jgi:hypothetical protein
MTTIGNSTIRLEKRGKDDGRFMLPRGCPTIQKREKKEAKYGFISKKKQNFLCRKQL